MELRDGDKKRYGGKGVLKAVRNVNQLISKVVKGLDVSNLRKIDAAMIKLDGTPNKRKLGANAILGVSLACAHAGAYGAGVPMYRWLREIYRPLPLIPSRKGRGKRGYQLPIPMFNVLNGGRHADFAADVQEFMIIPRQRSFARRFECGAEVYHALHGVLKARGLSTGLGDEGGFAPRLKKNEEAFSLLTLAIKKAGYTPGRDVEFGIDPAASEFYDKKKEVYVLKVDKQRLKAARLAEVYRAWMKKYPLRSIEDPFAEDDWEAWTKFNAECRMQNAELRIVGDDLFTTNIARIRKGIKLGAANTLLVKVNQIGTLSQTIDAITLAQRNGLKINISHRSGETYDTTIADLAVAVNAEYIKSGAPARSERVAKYNRLMEIEKELGAKKIQK